jgi:hypothetical protein
MGKSKSRTYALFQISLEKRGSLSRTAMRDGRESG